jgi:lysophospholipase L1-like esterase
MSSSRRTWLAALPILGLSLGAWGVGRSMMPTNPAIVPEERKGAWERQHQGFVEVARKGDVALLFLGDSITALWDKTAPAIWSRYYAPRRAANFGIGGDRTQHILWRLDHGELEGIRPKVVVLLIGTNNLGDNSEDEVVEGVEAVVGRLLDRLPGSKVLLLGLFPRGNSREPGRASAAPDPRVARLNARLAGRFDGKAVRFLDIGPAFLDGAGQIPASIEPDFLHLSRKGYQIWADAMEPTLWEMMER